MAITRTYEGAEPCRVNKWLAQSGLCSRREAEALIAEGLVMIDGEPVREPGHKIRPGQTLSLTPRAKDKLRRKLTIVLHKPGGVVSGQPEPGQVPAVRLLRAENRLGPGPVPGRRHTLAPAGRLDQDSRGLLILTEDGVVAKSIIGPESALTKEYLVRVKGKVTAPVLERLRHGIELDGRPLKRAEVEEVVPGRLRFVLREGRNRQIRRMCDAVDLRVTDLYRVRVGPIQIGSLPEGKWRHMGAKARAALIEAAKPRPQRSS